MTGKEIGRERYKGCDAGQMGLSADEEFGEVVRNAGL